MFNVKGFRRIFIGEPMPDKNDPKYRERYEREVAAGKHFADATGISWLGARYVALATAHRRTFMYVMVGLVFLFCVGNLYRLVSYSYVAPKGSYSVTMQDSLLKECFLKHPK